MSHTPGPWEAVFPAAIDWRDPIVYGADRASRVAYLAGGGPMRAVDAPEARANAGLIAAAPDLLAACEAARKFLEQPVLDGSHTITLRERLGLIGGEYVSKQLSDAAAKATGKEPA